MARRHWDRYDQIEHLAPEKMNASTAFAELDDYLGSGDDPIRWKGQDTTPNNVRYRIQGDPKATDVRVGYYGGPGCQWITARKGTLAKLVADRRRLRAERAVKDRAAELSKAAKTRAKTAAAGVPSLARAEVRWAVEITYWKNGKAVDKPFLAGRFYFDSPGDPLGPRHGRGDMPPVATFDTRDLARERCKLVRGGHPSWRTTARPVKVRVEVHRVEGA